MARMTLDELVAQLRAAYGAGLRSVVLYGSAAACASDVTMGVQGDLFSHHLCRAALQRAGK